MNRRPILIMFCAVFLASPVFGQRSQLAREAAESLMRRFGVKVGNETVETLAAKIGQYGAKYGDEAIGAIRSTGPRAFQLIDDAGKNAPNVVRLLHKHGPSAIGVVANPRKLRLAVRYGDDAAKAMIKHPGVSESVVENFLGPGARALCSVSGRNARRIGMMADDGSLVAVGKADDILGVISRHGDRAADWVWRNKGALAFVAVATAFIRDPEPFLNGAIEVVEKGSEWIVKPIVEKAAGSINWNSFMVFGMAILAALILLQFGWRWILPRRNTSEKPQAKDQDVDTPKDAQATETAPAVNHAEGNQHS